MKEASYFGQRQLSVCWSQADHLFLSRKILGEEKDFKLKKAPEFFLMLVPVLLENDDRGSCLQNRIKFIHFGWRRVDTTVRPSV